MGEREIDWIAIGNLTNVLPSDLGTEKVVVCAKKLAKISTIDEERIYAEAGVSARVNAFEHEMGRAMATADVVVARAGASTCFELALTGTPAFLVPLPSAMRNHQHYNASAFAARLAAAEGKQDELTPGALAKWLFNKAEHPASLQTMSENMKSMSVPDAAGRVAALVERIAGGK